MKECPLVSIIIPLYNGSNFVAQAIDCALAQTYKNIEIIVVNDGSKDEGAGENICLSYGDKIRYFKKENGGCSSALNYGIRQAKGDFVSWLSHDDLYDPNKLEVQVKQYLQYGLDSENTLIASAGRIIDENGEAVYRPRSHKKGLLNSEEMFQHLLFGEGYNGCGLLIPKSLFDRGMYFREDMRYVLDWNLWQKLAICGARIYVDPTILVSNRQHSQQVTVKHKDLQLPELIASCKEIFEQLEKENKPEFMVQLFYFCYAKKIEPLERIEAYLQENAIPVSKIKKAKIFLQTKLVHMLKQVYYWLKRLLYAK